MKQTTQSIAHLTYDQSAMDYLRTQSYRDLADQDRLECLPHVKDLGVIVSSDLTWSKHIEVIVAKADKTLGLIKRLLKDTSDLKY